MSDRWIKQTRLVSREDDRNGNCTEAALASLFGVPLNEIPCMRDGDHTLSGESDELTARYWENVEAVFHRFGYQMLRIEGNFVPDGFYLADGQSPRGFGHFVVMHNGQMIHDPHPDNTGLIAVESVYLPVALDPAKQRSG